MIAVLAFMALVVAVAAPVCGHQGQPWPLAGLRRRLRARMPRRALLRGLGAPEGAPRVSRGVGGAPEAAQSRSAARVPSWAHTEPYTYEEAA